MYIGLSSLCDPSFTHTETEAAVQGSTQGDTRGSMPSGAGKDNRHVDCRSWGSNQQPFDWRTNALPEPQLSHNAFNTTSIVTGIQTTIYHLILILTGYLFFTRVCAGTLRAQVVGDLSENTQQKSK